MFDNSNNRGMITSKFNSQYLKSSQSINKLSIVSIEKRFF